MADLIARPAWDALELPVETGGVTLAPLPEKPLESVAPFRGKEAEVAAALRADLKQGTAVDIAAGRLIWTGLGQWFLAGTPPALDGLAAVTDQSDAWCGFRLTGARAAEVLARLVPIDLHPAAFPPGRAARTMLGHMMAVLISVPGGYDILVMRSFAATAVHDLTTAMRALAARMAL